MRASCFLFAAASVLPRDAAVFDGQNARALAEQLGKAAGRGVADHLRDLAHCEVGADEQMLRLTHPPPLNILRDAAPELPLKAALELAFAHAGDARKASERKVEGVVVGNVADHVLKPWPKTHAKGAGVSPRTVFSVRIRPWGSCELEHQSARNCQSKDLGKTWFLTCEEAEKALEAMQNG